MPFINITRIQCKRPTPSPPSKNELRLLPHSFTFGHRCRNINIYLAVIHILRTWYMDRHLPVHRFKRSTNCQHYSNKLHQINWNNASKIVNKHKRIRVKVMCLYAKSLAAQSFAQKDSFRMEKYQQYFFFLHKEMAVIFCSHFSFPRGKLKILPKFFVSFLTQILTHKERRKFNFQPKTAFLILSANSVPWAESESINTGHCTVFRIWLKLNFPSD